MLKYCEFAGIGVIPWAPLFAGRLSRPLAETSARDTGRRQSDGYQDPPKCTEEIIGRVERIARDKGWTMTQVTLAWVNAKVTSPIVGVSSVRASLFSFSRGA
jgi:aryl-alcohol dehydrogenase-like predicted oxidoreductase